MLFCQRNNEEDVLTSLFAGNKKLFFCQSPDNNHVNQRDLKSIWGTKSLQQNPLKTGSRERHGISQMLTLAAAKIYNNSEPSFVSRVDFN